VLCILVAGLLAQRADAQPSSQPMLHEFLPDDTKEDLDLDATTAEGQLPAAIRTPSGTIKPPDVSRDPDPKRVYSEHSSEDASFRPDRDTRRPDVEHYDDPFSPTLTPFKREYAYDAVREDYSLYVRGSDGTAAGRYRPVPVASAEDTGERRGEERFFGDLTLDLVAGQRVRVPTVGPDARNIKLLAIPRYDLSVWRDGADNWFVLGEQSGRVRLVSELAIAREAFGSSFADVAWQDLPRVAAQPATHQRAFQQVSAAIGLSRSMSPREAVSRMVDYFRSFEASEQPPQGQGDIYLDLALSRKGICRHRAFAFLVTALHLGIPTRFVHNEAHAWVEVNDGRLWHRIDLGGAASELVEQPHLDRPAYVPPPDPYTWPAGRDSAEDLAQRSRQSSLDDLARDSTDPNGQSLPSSSVRPQSALNPGASSAMSVPGNGAPAQPERPASVIRIDRLDRDIFRGYPLHIQGSVRAADAPCAHLRVDVVVLVGSAKLERTVGSLSTDEDGIYDGAVVLPRELPIGDHELVVMTEGNAQCGPGQAM